MPSTSCPGSWMPCTLRWMAPRSSTAASSAKHSEARCWSGHARSCLWTWWVGRGFGTLRGSLLMAQSVWCRFWLIVILHWAIRAPQLYCVCHCSRQNFKDATVLCHCQTVVPVYSDGISKLNHHNQVQLNYTLWNHCESFKQEPQYGFNFALFLNVCDS